tara:strand:- start:690 stop:854 length:165 start_codon:yes stop_codon:yes gene_type:complete
VLTAQLSVVGQHIGQPGRVRKQMLDEYLFFVMRCEIWNITPHWIAQIQQPTFDQ